MGYLGLHKYWKQAPYNLYFCNYSWNRSSVEQFVAVDSNKKRPWLTVRYPLNHFYFIWTIYLRFCPLNLEVCELELIRNVLRTSARNRWIRVSADVDVNTIKIFNRKTMFTTSFKTCVNWIASPLSNNYLVHIPAKCCWNVHFFKIQISESYDSGPNSFRKSERLSAASL